MSALHVQLWLIDLALVVYALSTLGLRWQVRSDRSRRSIGASAALICLAAPTLVQFGDLAGNRSLLQASLLLTTAGLFVLIPFALLNVPQGRVERQPSDRPESSPAHAAVAASTSPDPSPATGNGESLDTTLDLDETDRMFRAVRQTDGAIDLPDRSVWAAATARLVDADAWSGNPPEPIEPGRREAAVDAEVLSAPHAAPAPDDAGMAGGLPDAGDAHAARVPQHSTAVRSSRPVPSLAGTQYDDEPAREALDVLARTRNGTETSQRLHRSQRLVDAEREARVAAEELVDSQRALIDELQRDVRRLQRQARTLEERLERHVRALRMAAAAAAAEVDTGASRDVDEDTIGPHRKPFDR